MFVLFLFLFVDQCGIVEKKNSITLSCEKKKQGNFEVFIVVDVDVEQIDFEWNSLPKIMMISRR